jgi:23S rRNA pseudouridine1911/1915/1917 synthase
MEKASTIYKREHKPDFGHEQIEILYEDSYIAVIEKPSGMLSVPYPGSRARTALDALEQLMRKSGTYSEKHRPFVVHRLDRDTSGVMMFAMTEPAQKRIMETWQKMVTERLYRAVAENPRGLSLPENGIIDDPLAYNAYNVGFVPKHDAVPENVSMRKVHRQYGKKSIYERNLSFSGGKPEFRTIPARTRYRVIVRGATHTLFELSLDTGRKNQIRAHLASKGYPLAGDENYRAATNPFGRLALHARTLEFIHPFTGEHMKFEQPEPEEWRLYTERGDSHPVRPVWVVERSDRGSFRTDKKQHDIYNGINRSGSSPVDRRKTAGMDFIARGKLKGKKS